LTVSALPPVVLLPRVIILAGSRARFFSFCFSDVGLRFRRGGGGGAVDGPATGVDSREVDAHEGEPIDASREAGGPNGRLADIDEENIITSFSKMV
jgi:hypothetical protein